LLANADKIKQNKPRVRTGAEGNWRELTATLRKILHDEICSHERFEPATINRGKELTMYTLEPETNLLSLTFKDGSVENNVSLLTGKELWPRQRRLARAHKRRCKGRRATAGVRSESFDCHLRVGFPRPPSVYKHVYC